VVDVFPEGTTWCGQRAGRFRPALFQAAIDAGVPVVALRLSYQVAQPAAPTTLAAFLGDEALPASLRRVITADGLRVTVRTTSLIEPIRGSRRDLAMAAHAAVHSRCPNVAEPSVLAMTAPASATDGWVSPCPGPTLRDHVPGG